MIFWKAQTENPVKSIKTGLLVAFWPFPPTKRPPRHRELPALSVFVPIFDNDEIAVF